jgi:thiosulfate/3-mercaptopyruvate sulfurtransferase
VMPPVISSSWLDQHPTGVVLADVRWYLDGRSGRDSFRQGHIPRARFVDVERWLSGTADPHDGRHPLPPPDVFAEGMRRLGVNDSDAVIAYDDAGGVIAARLVWMLRVTGHDSALLDGGLEAWTGPLSQGDQAPPEPGDFVARPWPRRHVAEMADVIGNRHAVLIDARDADRYRGDQDPVDPRPGHIPGARSLPCRANLSPERTFLPVNELRRRFAALGVTDGTEVISYCGSGVTACHNLLALEHAGYAAGRLYPGSWSQYSHTDLPVETGDDPDRRRDARGAGARDAEAP